MAKTKADDLKDAPFSGAISRFLAEEAPKKLRSLIRKSAKDDILHPDYPYAEEMPADDYETSYDACQLELAHLQRWVRATGRRVVVIFEGRDAAGKGGAIRRLTENLNPRFAPVVALPAPSDTERSQWYFQRYIQYLPSAGQIVIFDRSWYNRAVVERVFGFSTDSERTVFFQQLPDFEAMLIHDGIILIKFWLAVSRAEQLRRFLNRESDPLKQWKLSDIDVKGLSRYDDYTAAISDMFACSHTTAAPWTIVLAEDKRRARINVMREVLGRLDYDGKRAEAVDPKIVGGPEILAKRLE
jgi:polyphosphate kinase